MMGAGFKLGRRRRGQRGSTLVEQALTLPILLAVIFGIVDLSRAVYAYHFVSNAAREATRWASVRSPASLQSTTSSQSTVQAYVSNVSGMGLDPTKITSTTTFLPPPHGSPSCPATAGGAVNNKPGCMVQVKVDYVYTYYFPFLPKNAMTLTSTSEMVITQ